mmetsp:Transcript_46709/g.130312  ORF Transcript_46709/g.130312 Transcript_46709/m.130312 type:complete len:410 (+) Transcript_46709:212-1441(+)
MRASWWATGLCWIALAPVNTATDGSDADPASLLLPLNRTGNHIAFVKTHATGSSTVSSILHRYAVNHGVAKALPEKASFTYKLDTEPMAKGPKLTQTPKLNCGGMQSAGPPFEMWSNHVIYHSRMDDVSKGGGNPATAVLVPGARGQVLTIVRDPADRFLSAYYKGNRQDRHGMSLSQWIHTKSAGSGGGGTPRGRRLVGGDGGPSSRANSTSAVEDTEMGRRLQMHSLNSMCQHLIRDGQPPGGGTEAEIMHKIRTGDWLVLVLERFDESLQLLREAYSWDMFDILYVAMKTTRTSHKAPLNEADRAALLKMSGCDTKLYQESLAVFEQRVEEYGKERMVADVEKFKTLNAKANEICVSKAEQEHPQCIQMSMDNMKWSGWAKHEIVKPKPCAGIAKSAADFASKLGL